MELVMDDNSSLSTIKVTHNTKRSWQTWCLQHLLRPFKSYLGRPGKQYPVGSPRLEAEWSTKKQCHVTERQVSGVWLYDLEAKSNKSGDEKSVKFRILYWSGGGWQSPVSSSHWNFFNSLLKRLPPGTILTIISYPLAPKSPAAYTFPKLLELNEKLLAESALRGETVTFMGDSSGGNIALCTPLEALRQDPRARSPHTIMAICPSTDLSRENPVINSVAKHDPILQVDFINSTASAWAGDWDKKDPRLSPLRSDHIHLLREAGIKVDGITAGYDMLGPDAVLFRDKCSKIGIKGAWLEWDKMMHCFTLTSFYRISPEANQSLEWMLDILRQRAHETPSVNPATESLKI